MVLQLKVKRLDRAAERAGSGGACAYMPSSGAFTVRHGLVGKLSNVHNSETAL